MGCAPSKKNAEVDLDDEQRPLPAKDKKHSTPKGSKSPKKNKSAAGNSAGNNIANNNKDVPIVEECLVPVESSINTASAPLTSSSPDTPGKVNGSAFTETEIDSPGARDEPKSPVSEEVKRKHGDIWDLAKGMPPSTSPYDDPNAPPKPHRTYRHVNFDEDSEIDKKRSCGTFPRSRQKRPISARERYMEEDRAKKTSTLDRKWSLRERTPERRKDLDRSANVYMGNFIEPPGRGQKIPVEELVFLHSSEHHLGTDEEYLVPVPKTSVKDLVNEYLDRQKEREEAAKPKPPIKRPKKTDSDTSDKNDLNEVSMEVGEGDLSVIETVNKQVLEDYHEVERKSIEEIEAEIEARIAEEHRLKAEEEERQRILAEEAEKERLRLEEEERLRLEEEERLRLKEEERLRLEEEERIRIEEERLKREEEERLRLEEERLQAEQEAEVERQRLEEKKQKHLLEADHERVHEQSDNNPEIVISEDNLEAESVAHVEAGIPEQIQEGGDVDPAQHGGQQEDRFYNNSAFEKPDIDPSDPQQQDAALKIQTKYRQHHAKQEVGELRQEKAVVKIQAGYRGWHDRKRVSEMRSEADQKSQKAAEEAQEEDEAAANQMDIDLEDPEVAAAATKIQAGFKGYKARQEVQEMKLQKQTKAAADQPAEGDIDQGQTEEVDINLEDPEVAAAAAKIQAGFRGYKTRKDMAAIRDGQETSLPAPGEEQTEPQDPEVGDEAQEPEDVAEIQEPELGVAEDEDQEPQGLEEITQEEDQREEQDEVKEQAEDEVAEQTQDNVKQNENQVEEQDENQRKEQTDEVVITDEAQQAAEEPSQEEPVTEAPEDTTEPQTEAEQSPRQPEAEPEQETSDDLKPSDDQTESQEKKVADEGPSQEEAAEGEEQPQKPSDDQTESQEEKVADEGPSQEEAAEGEEQPQTQEETQEEPASQEETQEEPASQEDPQEPEVHEPHEAIPQEEVKDSDEGMESEVVSQGQEVKEEQMDDLEAKFGAMMSEDIPSDIQQQGEAETLADPGADNKPEDTQDVEEISAQKDVDESHEDKVKVGVRFKEENEIEDKEKQDYDLSKQDNTEDVQDDKQDAPAAESENAESQQISGAESSVSPRETTGLVEIVEGDNDEDIKPSTEPGQDEQKESEEDELLQDVNKEKADEPKPEEAKSEDAQAQEAQPEEPQADEKVDIDLNDPEVEKAATKIQAGFHGMKVRKEMHAKKEAGGDKEGEGQTEDSPPEGEGQTEQLQEGEEQTSEEPSGGGQQQGEEDKPAEQPQTEQGEE